MGLWNILSLQNLHGQSWETRYSVLPRLATRHSKSRVSIPIGCTMVMCASYSVLSFKVCKYSFYSILSFHSFLIFPFQFLNWYILLAYVFFVSSIATAANRNITDLSDGIEVLILMVLLYFLFNLSIQLVVSYKSM